MESVPFLGLLQVLLSWCFGFPLVLVEGKRETPPEPTKSKPPIRGKLNGEATRQTDHASSMAKPFADLFIHSDIRHFGPPIKLRAQMDSCASFAQPLSGRLKERPPAGCLFAFCWGGGGYPFGFSRVTPQRHGARTPLSDLAEASGEEDLPEPGPETKRGPWAQAKSQKFGLWLPRSGQLLVSCLGFQLACFGFWLV